MEPRLKAFMRYRKDLNMCKKEHAVAIHKLKQLGFLTMVFVPLVVLFIAGSAVANPIYELGTVKASMKDLDCHDRPAEHLLMKTGDFDFNQGLYVDSTWCAVDYNKYPEGYDGIHYYISNGKAIAAEFSFSIQYGRVVPPDTFLKKYIDKYGTPIHHFNSDSSGHAMCGFYNSDYKEYSDQYVWKNSTEYIIVNISKSIHYNPDTGADYGGSCHNNNYEVVKVMASVYDSRLKAAKEQERKRIENQNKVENQMKATQVP